jgi:hypothetical protein
MEEIIHLSSNNSNTTPLAKPPQVKAKKAFNFKRLLLNFFLALLILVTVTGTLGFFFVYVPGHQLLTRAQQLKQKANDIKAVAATKDLVKIKQELESTRNLINQTEADYRQLQMIGSLPYVKDYYQDGKNFLSIAKDGLDAADIVIKALEPYQDFLGLKGGSASGDQTTEDRISFLTQSIEGLVPHLDTIEKKVDSIEKSLNQIDASRYPEEYQGIKIQSQLLKAKELIAEGHQLIRDGKPILTKTSWLLGKDAPRNYLMIFQNNAELRPSGGFWTAYGTLTVSNGKITPGVSDDIYSLDAQLNSTIPAPRPIKAYHINVPYLNLRDMNLSPDFPTDAAIFLDNYQKITKSKSKIDAVVALDTQVLVDIVKVIGRVGVPGWGNFSAEPDKRCDGCPQIIYQLEWIAGRPRNYIEKDRKGFMGPLMHSLLANAMGSEKSKISPLVQAGLNNIHQKHIMLYFPDTQMQQAAELANIGGKITTPANTDYLHINMANMSSAKTNLFLKHKVKHEIISKNGKVEHKITITYTNPSRASNCNLEKGDLCLNAPKYREWFRFYTPTGSKLDKMTGSEVEPVVYEELGKQVFEGFFGNQYPLYAQSSSKVSLQYTSSIPANSSYTLLLQKQPGTKPFEYELWVNGKKAETFSWVADKTIKLSL